MPPSKSNPVGFIGRLNGANLVERPFLYCAVDLRLDGDLSSEHCKYTARKLVQIADTMDYGSLSRSGDDLLILMIRLIEVWK